MKGRLYITMKTPDVLDWAVERFASYEAEIEGLSSEERRDRSFEMAEDLKDKLAKWFKYGESVTLVYDAEADTMEVQKR